MGGDHKGGETFVDFRVDRVANNTEHIETGENGLCEFDVLGEWDGRVVAAANGIGGSDDGTAGLKGGYNPSLGDGDGLLFHCFVDGGSGMR